MLYIVYIYIYMVFKNKKQSHFQCFINVSASFFYKKLLYNSHLKFEYIFYIKLILKSLQFIGEIIHFKHNYT